MELEPLMLTAGICYVGASQLGVGLRRPWAHGEAGVMDTHMWFGNSVQQRVAGPMGQCRVPEMPGLEPPAHPAALADLCTAVWGTDEEGGQLVPCAGRTLAPRLAVFAESLVSGLEQAVESVPHWAFVSPVEI